MGIIIASSPPMFKDAALPRHFLTSAMLASAMLCALPVAASAQSAPAPAPVAAPVAPTAAPQIRLEVLTPGTGARPTDEDVVLVNYEGRLVDGTVFDANPRAPLSVNRLIPGFTQGLKQMQKGGRYRLTIPAALGYVDNATGSIPPNSDLIFTVELPRFRAAVWRAGDDGHAVHHARHASAGCWPHGTGWGCRAHQLSRRARQRAAI